MQFSNVMFSLLLVSGINAFGMENAMDTQSAGYGFVKLPTIGEKLYAKSTQVHVANRLLQAGIEELNAEKVKTALDSGAYPQFCHVAGTTYLHMLASVKDAPVYTIACHLINAGTNVNALNAAQDTPLDVTFDQLDHGLVRLLIEAGARIDYNRLQKLTYMYMKGKDWDGQELSFDQLCRVYNSLEAVLSTASHDEVKEMWSECVSGRSLVAKRVLACRPFETNIKLVELGLFARKWPIMKKTFQHLQPVAKPSLELSIERVVNALLPILKQEA